MQDEQRIRMSNMTVKLDALEALFSRIIEKAQELVFVLNESGHIVFVNSVWNSELGYENKTGVGAKFTEFIHEDDQDAFDLAFERVVRERIPSKGISFRLEHADKSWRNFVSSLVPQIDTQGNLICVSGIGRDVTEEVDVDRMKEEFLSVVSHELRNPLTSVKGYISLMRRKGTYDEAMLEMALAQTEVLQRLTNDLLDLSRLQTGRLTLNKAYVFLPDLARDVVDQMASTSPGHTLDLSVEPDFPGFQGDPVRLKQTLSNLISNAIKYSPRGGRISVVLSYTPFDVTVSVTDEGLGIPAEKLPKVWNQFYRAEQSSGGSYEGLGLGLHIVKAIIEAHGGRVWATSSEGEGSTFGFTLPLADYSQQGDSGIRL